MKIRRNQLTRIIREELIREQTRTEVEPAVFDRVVQLMDKGMSFEDALAQARADVAKDQRFQPRRIEVEPGIRRNERGMLTSYGKEDPRSPGMYTHFNVIGDGSFVVHAPGEEFSTDRAEIYFKDEKAPPTVIQPKPKPEPEVTTTADYDEPSGEADFQPRSWTDDPSSTADSIEKRWFPKNAKVVSLQSSDNGAYVDLIKNNGDGPWYVTPGMPGGLKQEHFGRTEWGWWQMTKDGSGGFGINYTPKEPGGRVGDWDDPSDPDIGRVTMSLIANSLPAGYTIESFNLDNMFFRFEGTQQGLGLEGDVKLSGKRRPDVDQENKQKNKLLGLGELRDFLKDIFSKGSASTSIRVDTPLGKVPITLKAR